MRYIGLDIGGSTIKAGLVDETGQILEARTAPTPADDLNGLLLNLTELIRDFQKSSSVTAIGMGVPGLRSAKTRRILTSPNIPCLTNINLEELVANQVHMRVIGENDANAAAYGEFVCGAGAGVPYMVYLTLGTGLGSGLILNGDLYTGASGYGGEFGHTVISPGGRQCRCGAQGCLETIVSATGIVRTAIEKGMQGPLTAEMVHEAAVRGDAVAAGVFKETGYYLGIACANLMNLFNPLMIVIGGGVMASGRMLLDSAVEAARTAFAASYNDCRLVQSKLWPDAGVIGAAMLARDR